MSKIGVGIVTCNRHEMYRELVDSLPFDRGYDYITVNDGKTDESESMIHDDYMYVANKDSLGVGKSKNIAIQYLLSQGCDYIFIIEDDMRIKDPEIFNKYIHAHKSTGISHFMFGYHGPANKNGISGGAPVPTKVINYGDPNIPLIALNHHCVGAFCMYTRESLEDVGVLDENYLNAFEHVDHSYMLAKRGYSTPYWWWADLANSMDLIEEQACSEDNSAITPRSDWQSNINEAWGEFTLKHGCSPIHVPVASFSEVEKQLKLMFTTRNDS